MRQRRVVRYDNGEAPVVRDENGQIGEIRPTQKGPMLAALGITGVRPWRRAGSSRQESLENKHRTRKVHIRTFPLLAVLSKQERDSNPVCNCVS